MAIFEITYCNQKRAKALNYQWIINIYFKQWTSDGDVN
jgi:hypothetical protein